MGLVQPPPCAGHELLSGLSDVVRLRCTADDEETSMTDHADLPLWPDTVDAFDRQELPRDRAVVPPAGSRPREARRPQRAPHQTRASYRDEAARQLARAAASEDSEQYRRRWLEHLLDQARVTEEAARSQEHALALAVEAMERRESARTRGTSRARDERAVLLTRERAEAERAPTAEGACTQSQSLSIRPRIKRSSSKRATDRCRSRRSSASLSSRICAAFRRRR